MIHRSLTWILALSLTGCCLSTDQYIGMDYRYSPNGMPIREKKVIDAGDPIMVTRSGRVLMLTKHSLYIRYTDVDDSGCYHEDVDKIVYRVPKSDPPFWYKLDFEPGCSGPSKNFTLR